MRGRFRFEHQLFLPLPRPEVFAFFADAENLERITPPFLHFTILTPPPVAIRPGALIDYRLRLHGIPLRWRTEISVWEPPHRFVDRQLKGPYRLWVHEHRFEEVAGGTLMRDRVDYLPPGGLFAKLIDRWLVRPDVERIFAYRSEKIQEILGVECGGGPMAP
ncbi:MAG: SRPBCC family protein [Acidobacteriota bacterium]